MGLFKLKTKYSVLKYQFTHWIFQWKIDNENDITLVICNCIGFTKYKEHTIFIFGKQVKALKPAPKYVME